MEGGWYLRWSRTWKWTNKARNEKSRKMRKWCGRRRWTRIIITKKKKRKNLENISKEENKEDKRDRKMQNKGKEKRLKKKKKKGIRNGK